MNGVEVTLEQIQSASETQLAGKVQGCLRKLQRLAATECCTCQIRVRYMSNSIQPKLMLELSL